jgi:hypothetical protein
MCSKQKAKMTETRGTKEFFRFFACGQFIFHPILMFFFYITNQILTDLPWLLPFSKYKEGFLFGTKIINFVEDDLMNIPIWFQLAFVDAK